MKYSTNEGMLGKGDRLFIYTDGITEAMNREGQQYSDDRLIGILNANKDLDGEDLIKVIQNDIKVHVKDEQQSDDMTIVVLRYSGF